MDLSRLLLPGLAVLLILAVLPVLRAAPLRQITRAGANSLLGLGALLLVNLTAPLTGVSLGFNLFNALVTLVLGVPGLGLLLLVQWVLT
ncbi:MAG: Pro-sigmaK processing inhibitor BofA [Oscillospiraceae bacterium]|jgi:inhibitor of the pro-sigma K processing machinery|nr:Pro-sigmaK processing inhibitor BofA [Oscillospiraceae bacterium]